MNHSTFVTSSSSLLSHSSLSAAGESDDVDSSKDRTANFGLFGLLDALHGSYDYSLESHQLESALGLENLYKKAMDRNRNASSSNGYGRKSAEQRVKELNSNNSPHSAYEKNMAKAVASKQKAKQDGRASEEVFAETGVVKPRVRIVGLISAPEFNSTTGTFQLYDAENDRYIIKSDRDGKHKALRENHIVWL